MPSINLLPSTISVARPTYAQDPSGGILPNSTANYPVIYTGIPASIQPASSSIMMAYAARQITISNVIYITKQITLKNGDIISDGTYTYRVFGFKNVDMINRLFAIDCEVVL